ncbi:MAG: FHA domain-containing protein [SAR202 cluster bacterium]|nr:FHA domain-containing protein [SAR202 cluster bacterium]
MTLTGKALTLGRRPDNDLVVDEVSVSRRHALVMETAGGYVVRDLNSTSGNFVNRERIADGERVLRHGDRIRIGGSQVVFIFRNETPGTLWSVPPRCSPSPKKSWCRRAGW